MKLVLISGIAKQSAKSRVGLDAPGSMGEQMTTSSTSPETFISGIFHNREFKRALIWLLLFQAIIASILLMAGYIETQLLKKEIFTKYASATGRIVKAHPEFETVIVEAFTKNEDKEATDTGKKILSRYGFKSSIDMVPFYASMKKTGILLISGILVLSFLCSFLILLFGYNIFYKKVRSLSFASEQVVEGNYAGSLSSVEEGDFGILENRFNQMFERIKQGMESLKAEKAFLRETISDISHQLKTPLSTLLINTELMLHDTDMNNETRISFLKRNTEQLKRMEWLTQSLLKMARLEAGSIVFKNEKLHLAEIVSDAVFALEELAESRKIKVVIKEERSQVEFTGDGEWLKEALINILKNAYEHSFENGEVAIEIFDTALSYGVIVRDYGIGILEKDLPNIFKRFYKASNSVKQNSVGIGLALSKSIIEGQRGGISVKSTYDKGSEFTVTFLKWEK